MNESYGNECASNSGDGETVLLLRELVRTQRRSLRTARLCLALCLAVCLAGAAALAWLVPAALGTLRHAEAALDRTAALADTAGMAAERIGNVLDNLDNGSLSGVLTDDSLAEGIRNFQEGMDEFRTAMGRLNAIDFDALNQAVRDISEVAAPLRGLLGR